jgi:hypothetical protein
MSAIRSRPTPKRALAPEPLLPTQSLTATNIGHKPSYALSDFPSSAIWSSASRITNDGFGASVFSSPAARAMGTRRRSMKPKRRRSKSDLFPCTAGAIHTRRAAAVHGNTAGSAMEGKPDNRRAGHQRRGKRSTMQKGSYTTALHRVQDDLRGADTRTLTPVPSLNGVSERTVHRRGGWKLGRVGVVGGSSRLSPDRDVITCRRFSGFNLGGQNVPVIVAEHPGDQLKSFSMCGFDRLCL